MLLSALFLAGGALALSRPECFSAHGGALAAYSDCGKQASLNDCFAHLSSYSIDDIEVCFITAGCSPDTSLIEARFALDRCDEWARASELKRRFRAYVPHLPARTAAPGVDRVGSSPNPRSTGGIALNVLFGRQENSKITECYTTSTVDTTSCDVETSNNRLHTKSCSSVQEPRSDCKPGLTCTKDKEGEDVCMELQNALDTAGIIIAIVFSAALALGAGTLTYLCCKDRRQQKRLTAKAEATALARAATKKQRANEARTPLMRQQDGAAAPSSPLATAPLGGHDPFGDQHRS